MTVTHKNIFNLDELSDYKVADNYSDVRGWEVKDAQNRMVGKVDHLLVNKTDERVVYLDVEVDETLIEEGYNTYQSKVSEGVHGFLNEQGENHLMIPIGMVTIDKEKKMVGTNQIDYSTFAQAKRYKKGEPINFDYELNLLRHYRGDKTSHPSNMPAGFYERNEFNDTIDHIV